MRFFHRVMIRLPKAFNCRCLTDAIRQRVGVRAKRRSVHAKPHRIWSVNMQRAGFFVLACAAIFAWPPPSSAADTGDRLALIIPNGLSGGVGSWTGPGWYVYWPVPNNPINSQLHRGPYATQDECQADLKGLRDLADTQDHPVGLPPSSDPDRCAYFGVQPNFDQPY